jgi:predicted neutral ceramidase superfamily lipid hydrolase
VFCLLLITFCTLCFFKMFLLSISFKALTLSFLQDSLFIWAFINFSSIASCLPIFSLLLLSSIYLLCSRRAFTLTEALPGDCIFWLLFSLKSISKATGGYVCCYEAEWNDSTMCSDLCNGLVLKIIKLTS